MDLAGFGRKHDRGAHHCSAFNSDNMSTDMNVFDFAKSLIDRFDVATKPQLESFGQALSQVVQQLSNDRGLIMAKFEDFSALLAGIKSDLDVIKSDRADVAALKAANAQLTADNATLTAADAADKAAAAAASAAGADLQTKLDKATADLAAAQANEGMTAAEEDQLKQQIADLKSELDALIPPAPPAPPAPGPDAPPSGPPTEPPPA